MKARENPQSRKHYRIRYPVDESPLLLIGTRSYPILDLSEMGARVFWQENPTPPKLLEIEGSIRFRNHVVVPVKGSIIRIQNSYVAINLSEGVPMSIIMAEQRYLLKKFRAQE